MLWLLLPAALAAPSAEALSACQTRERPAQCLTWLAAAEAPQAGADTEAAAEALNSAAYSMLAACPSRDGTGCALESGEDNQDALIAQWCTASPPALPASLLSSLCLHLGELRERGLGEPRDAASALAAFRVSCDGGSYFGCLAMIRNGDDHGETVIAAGYREGCLGGSVSDCDQLVLFTDDEDERRMARARACEGDVVAACYSLSLQHLADKDTPAMMATLQRACELGSHDACLDLTHYQELEAAAAAPEAACSAGDMDACHQLGLSLADKAMTLPSATWEPAAAAFEAACGARHQPACGELGGLLYHGRGLERDRDRAAKLFRRACKAEYWPACDGYAEMLRFGESMDEDPQAAVAVLEPACAGGYPDACWSLGWMREDDAPVQNPRAAIDAWMSACALGMVDGCEQVLERLGQAATPADAHTILDRYAAEGEAGAEDLKWFILPALKTSENTALLASACGAGDADACAVQSALTQ